MTDADDADGRRADDAGGRRVDDADDADAADAGGRRVDDADDRGSADGEPRSADATVKPRRSLVWVALLLVVGALGVYLAAPDAATLHAAAARLRAYAPATIAIVVGGAVGLVITEALRIAVIARLVGVRVGARDAWDAAVANHVMTAITPQVGLGEPTVAYLLHKRGAAWDAAVAIPFVKFTTSLALVFAIGAVLVACGFGPPLDARLRALAIVWFAAIAAITIAVIAIMSRPVLARRVVGAIARWAKRRRWFGGAAWRDRIDRAVDVTLRTVDRLASVATRSSRAGEHRVVDAGAVAVLVAVHLVYYASYIAPLVGLALVIGDPPLVAITARAMVYLCFVFAMPTPGGAGPSEAAAGLVFGDLVAPADALVIVVVFRAATFYLQLAIGALYVPLRSLARSRG